MLMPCCTSATVNVTIVQGSGEKKVNNVVVEKDRIQIIVVNENSVQVSSKL